MLEKVMDPESLAYAKMTADEELVAVSLGDKPAALGFWDEDKIPHSMYYRMLVPVPGRYYKTAIAGSPMELVKVVNAYYEPMSMEADIRLGAALGYSNTAIANYVSRTKYPKPAGKFKQRYWKIKSTIEKLGVSSIIITAIGALFGHKLLKNILRKEGF